MSEMSGSTASSVAISRLAKSQIATIANPAVAAVSQMMAVDHGSRKRLRSMYHVNGLTFAGNSNQLNRGSNAVTKPRQDRQTQRNSLAQTQGCR